ncbi:hypothetical protein NDK50_21680 [Paraburkholderia bryophila]|uniref:hypothetical protein n=1 Tax=Paraburkholderia bryophila TaxID=420952 RepID=UPI00234B48FC|nr:hypothetical protein [Paraburkholderia bryophila]WCM23484.1 hypothetical protein NDK50_21680 [Paraburkholderia bryophila]
MSGDNGIRDCNLFGNECTRVCAKRHVPVADPCTISLFPTLKTQPVTSQQTPTAPRKSLTLLQLLGLIGGAGLIAAIVLNQFV